MNYHKILNCSHCGSRHVDENKLVNVIDSNGEKTNELNNFGITPHRKHACLVCGKLFVDPDNEKSIGV